MRLNFKSLNLNYVTPVAGITGCCIISYGLFESATHYTRAMAYSPKNHFISELGLADASKYAYVFNFCINTGGVLLMVFAFGLGYYLRRNLLARLAALIGMAATLSFSAIGYYTAATWTAHKNAASIFFTGAMISIVLFSYCIWNRKQRNIHHFISIQGFIIAFIYFVVLAWPKGLLTQSVNDPANFVRPDLWGLTVLEWSYCLLIGSWIMTVSLDLLYVLSIEGNITPINNK